MKKLVLALCVLVGAASADWLQGSISRVDEGRKTIYIEAVGVGQQVAVKILPTTRVELDECGWFGLADSWIFTDNGDFWDLEVGRYVEIDDAYPAGGVANVQNVTATKVEVKCGRKGAY